MLADLDPLTWDAPTRNLVQGAVVVGHILCVLIAVFLLDPLLPHTNTPGMSKRKASERVVLMMFVVLATAVAAFGVYFCGRLLYDHALSLPGAPSRSGRLIAMIPGHLVMSFVVFHAAWSLLRQRPIMRTV